MTNEIDHNDDAWQPCDAGEIQQFVRRRKNRRRAVFAAQLAAGAVFGGILALLYTGMPNFLHNDGKMREYHFGGIACEDVRSHAQAYMKGELDPATAEKIRLHLKECPECPKLIEQMKRKNQGAGRRRPGLSPGSRTVRFNPPFSRQLFAYQSE